MKSIAFLTILFLAQLSTGYSAQWSLPAWGISKGDVKNLYPTATPFMMPDGKPDEDHLVVSGITIDSQPFKASFKFANSTQRLTSIWLHSEGAVPDTIFVGILLDRLTAKYGSSVKDVSADGKLDLMWRPDKTAVTLYYSPTSTRLAPLNISYSEIAGIDGI